MKLTIDTAVCKREIQAQWLVLKNAFILRLKLLGEIVVLLAKACYFRMFHSQIYTTCDVDVDGFRNVYELESFPSVTPGYVRLHYRQTVNGQVKAHASQLVTVKEWDRAARRAAGRVAYGAGRLVQAD